MLGEALGAGISIAELYVTRAAYDEVPLLPELEAAGTPTFLLDNPAAASISDVQSPSGIVAVAALSLRSVEELFGAGTPILVLADLNDPANAGTLLRSADAFGCAGVVFGPLGVDPYHPKVVRGSMGAVFHLQMSVAGPAETADAAAAAGVRILGLAVDGVPPNPASWEAPLALVVGHERRGLGRWEGLCSAILAIPMAGAAESLSAAVAGSIALYEATRRQRDRAE